MRRYELPYTQLSDPQLEIAERLDVPTLGAPHPAALKYPKRRFLQPALFIWLQSGELAHQWRQTPTLKTLYGARGRPSPEDVLRHVREALGEA